MAPYDRRRSDRIPVAAFAALETDDVIDHNNQIFGAVADISRTGIAIHVATEPRIGQRMLVRLALGERIHELIATVTRVSRRKGYLRDVGLDWSKCAPEELAFLEDFLASVESS